MDFELWVGVYCYTMLVIYFVGLYGVYVILFLCGWTCGCGVYYCWFASLGFAFGLLVWCWCSLLTWYYTFMWVVNSVLNGSVALINCFLQSVYDYAVTRCLFLVLVMCFYFELVCVCLLGVRVICLTFVPFAYWSLRSDCFGLAVVLTFWFVSLMLIVVVDFTCCYLICLTLFVALLLLQVVVCLLLVWF